MSAENLTDCHRRLKLVMCAQTSMLMLLVSAGSGLFSKVCRLTVDNHETEQERISHAADAIVIGAVNACSPWPAASYGVTAHLEEPGRQLVNGVLLMLADPLRYQAVDAGVIKNSSRTCRALNAGIHRIRSPSVVQSITLWLPDKPRTALSPHDEVVGVAELVTVGDGSIFDTPLYLSSFDG